jgi:hypothetical protein
MNAKNAIAPLAAPLAAIISLGVVLPAAVAQSAVEIGFSTDSLDPLELEGALLHQSPAAPTSPSFNQANSWQTAQISIEPMPVDVLPTHWAYAAVQSLVERYGCIAGYPDGTFRGDRAITRYEAAAAFSACFDTVVDVLETDRAAQQQEYEDLLRSMQELQEELGIEERRIDALEGDPAE